MYLFFYLKRIIYTIVIVVDLFRYSFYWSVMTGVRGRFSPTSLEVARLLLLTVSIANALTRKKIGAQLTNYSKRYITSLTP
jgi:hypothetical protein